MRHLSLVLEAFSPAESIEGPSHDLAFVPYGGAFEPSYEYSLFTDEATWHRAHKSRFERHWEVPPLLAPWAEPSRGALMLLEWAGPASAPFAARHLPDECPLVASAVLHEPWFGRRTGACALPGLADPSPPQPPTPHPTKRASTLGGLFPCGDSGAVAG